MRTCVIGGGGFIGRHVADALIATGRDVLVLGRRAERPSGLPRQVGYRCCDAGDRAVLRAVLDGCGEIVYLAHASVPKVAVADPAREMHDNLAPLLNLLEEAQELPSLRKLLITSSGGTVYGIAGELPITESHPTSPISSYGITKLAIERYTLMYHLTKRLPSTVVRPANAYGTGQRPFTGQGFIATAMGMVLKRQPVTIFGTNDTVRDYIHVRDVASGLVAALTHGLDGEIYNIGTSVGRSNTDVLDEIRIIAESSGLVVEVRRVEPRDIDVPVNVLSYEKILGHTGWRPREPFEAGLSEMWDELNSFLGYHE
jgi:Nucleoside-diphosphate-sugar epimerases